MSDFTSIPSYFPHPVLRKPSLCPVLVTMFLFSILASADCPLSPKFGHACRKPICPMRRIKPAAEHSVTRTIGVLGTPGTVRRAYVDDLIADFAADCDVLLQGSTRLVAEAEKKLAGQGVDMTVLREEIAPLFAGRVGADVDAVVLACTHFPLLRDELRAAVRQSVKWIDSGSAIARRLESVLTDIKESHLPDCMETAFLVGPSPDPVRAQAFTDYGFDRTVGLMGEKRF